MRTRTRKHVAQAVALATPTLYDLAAWLNVSYGTTRAYRQGVRTASPASVRRLALVLRRHAGRLTAAADRLDALAGSHP